MYDFWLNSEYIDKPMYPSYSSREGGTGHISLFLENTIIYPASRQDVSGTFSKATYPSCILQRQSELYPPGNCQKPLCLRLKPSGENPINEKKGPGKAPKSCFSSLLPSFPFFARATKVSQSVRIIQFLLCCRSLRQKSRLSGGQVNYREEEKRILDSILGRDVYDNRIRPSGLNGTGNAVFSIHTLGFSLL